jgi:hypothetical protein
MVPALMYRVSRPEPILMRYFSSTNLFKAGNAGFSLSPCNPIHRKAALGQIPKFIGADFRVSFLNHQFKKKQLFI